jgi:thymidylate synthase
MKDGFPLLTMKKTYPRGVFEELLWFLKGDTNIRYLNQKNVHIWDEWAYAKYKKYAESLPEPDYAVHVDGPSDNCTRIMTQEEFCKAIVDDEAFAKKWGDLGPIYGKQWVSWEAKPHTYIDEGFGGEIVNYSEPTFINQIQNVIDRLKTVPDCRRLIVNAWNVGELSEMALTPCHVLFQFITEPLTMAERVEIWEKNENADRVLYLDSSLDADATENHKKCDELNIPKFRLSLQLYQRSLDTFLGGPFNVSSFSLLLHMMAQVSNMVPYKFVHSIGDAHLYLNHKDQVNEFLNRTNGEKGIEKPFDFWEHIRTTGNVGNLGSYNGPPLPTLKLNPKIKNIFDFTIDDIELVDYNPLPAIKAPVAV